MPIKIERSNAWVDVPNGQLYVDYNRAWVSPKKVYIKRNGVWVDTGFVGKPGAPPAPVLTSDSYSVISVRANPPTSGIAPTFMRVAIHNEAGAFLSQQDVAPGGVVSFSVSQDTRYIFNSWAFNGAVQSAASPGLRRATGHPQQTYQQANYGWGPHQTDRPYQIDGTSAHAAGVHPGALAVDANNPPSAWVSDVNSGPTGNPNWEGLRFQLKPGNRLFNGMNVYGPGGQVMYIAWRQNGAWTPQGSVTPASLGMALSGYGHKDMLQEHNYYNGNGNGQYMKYFGPFYGLTGIDYVTIAITNLQYYDSSWRAQIDDVIYGFNEWTVVSYTTVESVAAVANSYW